MEIKEGNYKVTFDSEKFNRLSKSRKLKNKTMENTIENQLKNVSQELFIEVISMGIMDDLKIAIERYTEQKIEESKQEIRDFLIAEDFEILVDSI